MRYLIQEYKDTRRTVQKALETAEETDKPKLRSMVSDLTYAIEWMRSGVNPTGRGIQLNTYRKETYERRSMIEREVLVDPYVLQSIYYEQHETNNELDAIDAMWLEQALEQLAPMQRECYVLSVGRLWSYAMIADNLNIKRESVQKHVERAKLKIAKLYKGLSSTG